jgi:hypothetical protein
MNPTFTNAIAALVPTCMLLVSSTLQFSRRKGTAALLQLIGAACLEWSSLPIYASHLAGFRGCIGALSIASGPMLISPWWLRLPSLPAGTKADLRKTRRNWECCGRCILLPVVGSVPYPGRLRVPRDPARFAPHEPQPRVTVHTMKPRSRSEPGPCSHERSRGIPLR